MAAMLSVCLSTSGREVATLDADDFSALEESDGVSARTLKRYLAPLLGVSRFRLRLMEEGNSECLADDDQLKPLLAVGYTLQLVILGFAQNEPIQDIQFMSACAANEVLDVEQQLQRPQDPDVTDMNGRRAIHFTAANGHAECMRLLIEAGANKEAADKVCGATPLHLACLAGRPRILSLLLELGASTEVATQEDDSTPLHWVAETTRHNKRDLEVLKLLLDAGAEQNKARRDGWTAMHLVASNGQVQMLLVLLGFGAEINKVNGDGAMPLHVAAAEGNSKVVRALLEAGAEKDCRTRDTGATPLHLAGESGHHYIVWLLIHSGADKDLATTDDGATALHLGAQHGHLTVVKVLLQAGASKSIVTHEGATALDLAAARNHLRLMRVLAYNSAEADGSSLSSRSSPELQTFQVKRRRLEQR